MWALLAYCAFTFLASRITAEYLRFSPVIFANLALLAGLLVCLFRLKAAHSLRASAKVAFASFSGFLAISIVLGKHISINVAANTGTLHENYIEPYTAIDLVAFMGVAAVAYIFATCLYTCLPLTGSDKNQRIARSYSGSPVSRRLVLAGAACLFIAWFPFLVAYWPGFVFGDTTSSLSQALGYSSWSNHHPALFTAFLKGAMQVGEAMGLGRTAGLALYNLAQMIILAFVLSYLCAWLRSRFDLCRLLYAALLAYFALSSYIASYSVALWKDPLFSAGVVLFSLMIADLVFSKFEAIPSWRFLALLAFTALFISLMRNNGIYVVAFVLLALCVVWWRKAHQCEQRRPRSQPRQQTLPRVRSGLQQHTQKACLARVVAALAVAVAASWAITGPLYTAMGISKSEMVESVGIPLNQMARVAALGGDMTEEDREYLNSILPIDEWAEKYVPCCTDALKWDESFNSEALESDDFWGHWMSMLVRNPWVYFEAWELQTFGFWTFSIADVTDYDYNIYAGGPMYGESLDSYGVDVTNPNSGSALQVIFTDRGRSIPGSAIFWFLAYLSVCLVLRGSPRQLIVLLPSIALFATLFAASPIWYWPRYILAAQLLMPLYALMLLGLKQKTPAYAGVNHFEMVPEARVELARR